jgi:hypothetical protein
MEFFPARNERHATQQEKKKQRGKAVYIKDLHARNAATKRHKKLGKVRMNLPFKRAIK